MTTLLRRTGLLLAILLGLFLVVRAIAEPFVVDVTDPASYRLDWGGPSLPGVLLVHSGPGVLAAVLMVRALRRRVRRRRVGSSVQGVVAPPPGP